MNEQDPTAEDGGVTFPARLRRTGGTLSVSVGRYAKMLGLKEDDIITVTIRRW